MSYSGKGNGANDQRVWDGTKWLLAKRPLTQAQSLAATGNWDEISDYILITGAGPKTITLPKPTVVPRNVAVIDAAGAASSNPITVVAQGGGTIDGLTSVVLNVDHSVLSLVFVSTAGNGSWTASMDSVAPAGSVRGRTIDGGAGVPFDLTGEEQGANVRFDEISNTPATTETNWAPTGLDTATHIRVTTTANTTIQGIDIDALTSPDNRLIFVTHVSGAHDFVFEHESGSAATDAERVVCPFGQDLNVRLNEAAIFHRTGSRWRVIAAPHGTFDANGAGLVPASSNSATEYLDGQGTWGAVSLASLETISAGTQVGLQIDAGGAAVPVALTALEQGENIRYDGTQEILAVAGGDYTSTDFDGVTLDAIDPTTSTLHFTVASAAFVTIHGLPQNQGKRLVLKKRDSDGAVIFPHESTTETTVGARIQTPAQRPIVLSQVNDSVILEDQFGRWRATSAIYKPTRFDSLQFTDDFFTAATSSATTLLADTNWHISFTGTPTVGFQPNTSFDSAEHGGVVMLVTDANTNDNVCICKGDSPTADVFRCDKFKNSRMVVRVSDNTSMAFHVGVAQDLEDFGTPSESYALVRFDTSVDANFHFLTDGTTGTPEDTDTGVAVTATQWYVVDVIMTNDIWYCYIDGTLVATHSTTVPGNNQVTIGANVATLTTAARELQIDYFDFEGILFEDRT